MICDFEHWLKIPVPPGELHETMMGLADSLSRVVIPQGHDSIPDSAFSLSDSQKRAYAEHFKAGRLGIDTFEDDGNFYVIVLNELLKWRVKNQPLATGAIWIGNGRIRIGDDAPFKIPHQFAVVLEELIELQAAESDELDKVGGGAKKIREMLGKFPQLRSYVRCPGVKGAGGYRTSIQK